MMKQAWLTVQCSVSGLSVEKLLNAARKQGIRLKDVRRDQQRALIVRCAAGEYAAFLAMAQDKGYQVSPAEPVGLFRLIKRLAARGGLLAGAAVCLALMIYAVGFVWAVDVENAGAYAGEVRLYLEEKGIRPGIRRARVDIGAIREELEWRLPKVKWVRTEWRGVRLRILLEEGTPPPDLDAGGPGDLVAAGDGIVKWIAVYAGTPAVKPGDFVRAGQVLIRGEERRENGAVMPVRARGEVMARVWLTAQVRLPLAEYLSVPTGRQAERRVIRTPLYSFADREEPEYLVCDREIETLPVGGAWFPVALERETFAEVYLEKSLRDPEDVKREGARAALNQLNLLAIHDETVDKWLNFSMIERDTIVVEATAEVARQIAQPGGDMLLSP